MLSIHASAGGDAAKHYFFSGLVYGDYYSEGQERTGRWWGKGAELLGLSGSVETRDFCRLVDNQHPATGERLTLRAKAGRRAGYDLTVSPPKSVSIAALLADDDRLVDAVYESAQHMLKEVQQYVQTRVRKDGQVSDRFTNNITSALFLHLTARPEKGHYPDPQVHVHAYTMNATLDAVEAAWKALQFGTVKGMGRYFEAVFHNELARRARELGYAVERRGGTWELADIADSTIRKFSKRTEHINAVNIERGVEDAKLKAATGAKTRRGKAPEYSMQELRDNWRGQLDKLEAAKLRSLEAVRAMPVAAPAVDRQRDALRIVNSIASTRFERAATIAEHSFIADCLRRAPGLFSPEDFRWVIGESPSLLTRDLDGGRWITHRAIYKEECALAETVRKGKGTFLPVAPDKLPPEGLSKDQQAAFRHILSSRDQFILIEGKPGSGKTRLAKSIVPVLQGKLREALSPVLGDKVVCIAPTTIASREVLRGEGFAQANTLSTFLVDESLQSLARFGWILFDEAAQTGTEQARKFADLVRRLEARVIFVGDRDQNLPVARGNVFEILTSHAGVQSQRMEENLRQTGRLKEISSAFTQGEIEAGFRALASADSLKERSFADCHEQAAAEYVSKLLQGRKVAAMSPTHEGGGVLTGRIRAELKERRRLSDERECVQYRDLKYTAEEKRDVKNYQPGQMVQFHQNVPGFKANSRYRVIGLDPWRKHILVRGKGEIAEALPFKNSDCWAVYDVSTIDIAVGERIRLTRNVKVHTITSKTKAILAEALDLPEQRVRWPKVELANSSEHEVIGRLPNGDLMLKGMRILPADFGHVDYGYVRTSQALQSKTVDDMVCVATREDLGAVNRGSFVVVVTRPQRDLSVYTDDISALEAAAHRVDRAPSATDLVKYGENPSVRDGLAAEERSHAAQYEAWQAQQQKKEREHDR